VVPAGRSIPARGYLLIWADNEEGQTTAGSELHAGFSLSASGEVVGLYAPDGRQVDYVTFGPQADDVSGGRYVDGSADIYVMGVPTPRTTNLLFGATTGVRTGSTWKVNWNIRPATQYRLMYVDSLGSTNWQPYGLDIQTNAVTVETPLPMNTQQRFYRLFRIN